jgi:hypothetical protein
MPDARRALQPAPLRAEQNRTEQVAGQDPEQEVDPILDVTAAATRRPLRASAYGSPMSDTSAAGPFHVRVDADVRILDQRHVQGRSDAQLADLLKGLIERHAGEAGLQLVSPDSVQVQVSRAG